MSTPSDAQPGQPPQGRSGPTGVPQFGAAPPPGYAPAPGYGHAPGYGPAPGYGGPQAYGGPQGYGYGHVQGYGPGGVLFAPVAEYSSPGGRQLAGPADRLIARIIDSLILSAPGLLVEIPLLVGIWFWAFDRFDLGADPNTTAGPTMDGGDFLLVIGLIFGVIVVAALLNGLLSYLYDVVYMRRTGQTVGKRIMKLRVVRVEDGGPITARHARRRWLAQDGVALLALIPFVGSLVGIYNWMDALWLLWDKPHRQCLHDKYGQTAVVKLTQADLAKPAATELERAA